VLTLDATFSDELTGATYEGRTPVADILAVYPAALLVKIGS
jgi:hypothetical protein